MVVECLVEVVVELLHKRVLQTDPDQTDQTEPLTLAAQEVGQAEVLEVARSVARSVAAVAALAA